MDLTKAKKIIEDGVPKGYVIEFFENLSTEMGDEKLHVLPDKTTLEFEEAVELATQLQEVGRGTYFDFRIVKLPEYKVEKRI